MRIGLISVDNHAAKKKWGATVYPNIALGKIARWHRERGDDVEWAQPIFGEYDRIYASKIFNFSKDINPLEYTTKEWVKGGTGYDVRSELPAEVDRLQPDYSIFPNVAKDMAYGFLTRGCPNRCKWCVVPRKEGAIRPYMDVDEIAIEGRTKLVLMDNNILAAGSWAKAQLEKIIERGYRVDFNQALDARLVDDDFARLMAQVKWLDNNLIRFGCDTRGQVTECDKAMEMIEGYGFSGQFFLYTMLHGKMEECYERIEHFRQENLDKRAQRGVGRYVYCHAQPYRDPDDASKEIPQWQRDMAQWVNKKQIWTTVGFGEYEVRKGFRCEAYFS